jgi:hypothetical protein
MRMSARQLADEWAVVLVFLVLIVVVLAAMAQQPTKELGVQNCPVPPGPWKHTTGPDGTVFCIDPDNPNVRYP